VAVCLLCHAETEDEHSVDATIRAYADELGGIPWVQVNRVPGHVYFSHEAHVTYAKMECDTCHGDVAALTAPPTESRIDALTMARCMKCHDERGATNDCMACHK
jgi:c(7)-type cytochrome triheme protein